MKRKHLFILIGSLLFFLLLPSIALAEEVALEVLSPVGIIEPPPNLPISSRVTDLAGKKIGLYDNGKEGLTEFLNVVEELLKERYPTATILRYRGGFDLGDKMAADIAKEVDTFILGVGD